MYLAEVPQPGPDRFDPFEALLGDDDGLPAPAANESADHRGRSWMSDYDELE